MIQAKDTVLNSTPFTVVTFTAREGLAIKAKLLQLLAPAIAAMTSVKGGLADMDISGALVSKLCERLGEQEVVGLVMRMIQKSGARRNGIEITPESFDTDFAGDYMTLYQLLGFILEVNFGSFFAAIGIGKAPMTVPIQSTPISRKG